MRTVTSRWTSKSMLFSWPWSLSCAMNSSRTPQMRPEAELLLCHGPPGPTRTLTILFVMNKIFRWSYFNCSVVPHALAGSVRVPEDDSLLRFHSLWALTLLLETSPRPELCLKSWTLGFQIPVKIWDSLLTSSSSFFFCQIKILKMANTIHHHCHFIKSENSNKEGRLCSEWRTDLDVQYRESNELYLDLLKRQKAV